MIMKACMSLSALFLVMYVVYHMTSEPTPYGGGGVMKSLYFFILITTSCFQCRNSLVLFTFVRAFSGNFARHRKLAKITFPVWLYVAVTGVIVYLMISPYYK